MLTRLMLYGFLGVAAMAVVACGPAPEPPVVEEEPPPPPPPPTVYELTEAAITEEEPNFTSRNISTLGVRIGDTTRNVEGALGEIANTRNAPDDYITAYQDGGIVIYTFKLTGRVRQIEITSLFADEIASEPLRTWLEDGDLDQMRELMGEEAGVETPETDGDSEQTEYLYDQRGIRFIKYNLAGEEVNAIRFSEYRD
jgi:hypothetical protein